MLIFLHQASNRAALSSLALQVQIAQLVNGAIQLTPRALPRPRQGYPRRFLLGGCIVHLPGFVEFDKLSFNLYFNVSLPRFQAAIESL